jgi:hypothetical protein
MRKRIISATVAMPSAEESGWLDLEQAVAEVEVSSEDAGYPVENALLPAGTTGWRAAEPGRQTIRLRFGRPHQLRRIAVEFDERNLARTQEFCLRWSPDEGKTWREVVRQQWNFSPEGAPTEHEDYQVALAGVSVLELEITPDVAGGDALASLTRLRLA